MRSAGINFGIPESEWVLEVEEDGSSPRCWNPVTGEELGGGGGVFSTAEVTITNSTGNEADINIPNIDENGVLQTFFTLDDNGTKIIETPVPENGALYFLSLVSCNVTGGVQFISDEMSVLITGDGTLEILEID